jgi:C-terminal processing protease CtpA/Prc
VYFLKKQSRATIVGEITGGGYRVDAFKLPYNFYFVNSIYTSFDTDKGEGWQGTGIKPDILTTSKDAFDKVLSIIK